jgi:DnaD/phage-associated family protein
MQQENGSTQVSNNFIDGYMPKANPVYSIIYIYGVRMCAGGVKNLSTSEFSKVLNILESDVTNAWKYWESEGLVKVRGTGEDMVLEFLPVPYRQTQTRFAPKNCVLGVKPRYDPEELELYQKSTPEVRVLFKKVEAALGTFVTHEALSTIFSLHEWLGLPLDVVDFLLTCCVERGKNNIRYIEQTAISWADEGIDTLEKATRHVLLSDNIYKEIMAAFGIYSKYPATSQKTHFDRWLKDFRMPVPVILEAIDKAVLSQTDPTIPYVNGILKKWNDLGIHTLEDAKKDSEAFIASKKSKPKAASHKPYAQKNRFVNFTQRNNDYAMLERLEFERLKENVKDRISAGPNPIAAKKAGSGM